MRESASHDGRGFGGWGDWLILIVGGVFVLASLLVFIASVLYGGL